jgi:hypothetical protein
VSQRLLKAFLKTNVRRLFPKQKVDSSRWRDVCLRFENLVLICRDNPEVVTVLIEKWVVVRKTLLFSTNWFLASANICGPMPFKLIDQLLLLATIPKR